jgi:hypothetical protein
LPELERDAPVAHDRSYELDRGVHDRGDVDATLHLTGTTGRNEQILHRFRHSLRLAADRIQIVLDLRLVRLAADHIE